MSTFAKFTLMVNRKEHFSDIYVFAGGIDGYKVGSRHVMNENLNYVMDKLIDCLERGFLLKTLEMLDDWETEKEKWNRESGIETDEICMN